MTTYRYSGFQNLPYQIMGMSYLFSKMWVWIAIGWMPKWYGQNFDDRLVWCQNTNTRRENSHKQLKCGPCECCQFESCQCPLSRNQPNECPCARHRRWVWRHHGECMCHQFRFIAMLGKGRMWMSIVFATFCLLQMVYIFTTSHHWQLWLLANRNVKNPCNIWQQAKKCVTSNLSLQYLLSDCFFSPV